MFYSNVPARFYDLRVEYASTPTRTTFDGMFVQATITVTWGRPYGPTHGLKVTIRNYYAPFVGTPSHEAIFEIPMYGVFQIRPGAGWLSPYDTRLLFEGVDFSEDCVNWSLDWTAVKWYVEGVLEHTEGARSSSGGSYDPRENCFTYGYRTDLDAPPLFASGSCSDTALTNAIACGTATASWKWSEDGVTYYSERTEIDLDLEPPDPPPSECDCSCIYELPDVNTGDSNGDSFTDTGNLTLEALLSYTIDIRTKEIRVDCKCPDGTYADPPPKVRIDEYHQRYRKWETEIRAYPRNAPRLRDLRKTGAVECKCVDPGPGYTIEIETDTKLYCYLGYTRYVLNMDCLQFCQFMIEPGGCPILDDDTTPGGSDPCEGYEDINCQYTAYTTCDYPAIPPCGTGNPWNTYEPGNGRYHIATVSGANRVSNSKILYKRAYTDSPKPSWESEVEVTSDHGYSHPRMVYGPRKRIYLVGVREEPASTYNVYEWTSDDDGRTWNIKTLAIPNAELNDIAILQGEVRYLLEMGYVPDGAPGSSPGTIQARRRASGDSAWGALYTFKDTTGANLSVARATWHVVSSPLQAGQAILECMIYGESESSTWFSLDNGLTWTRFV